MLLDEIEARWLALSSASAQSEILRTEEVLVLRGQDLADALRPLQGRTVVDRPRHGVVHSYSLEQLRAFRDVPAVDKLRWLERMRSFLARSLTPEKMHRFRRGDL